MHITQTFWLWKKCYKIAFIGYLTRKTKHRAPIKDIKFLNRTFEMVHWKRKWRKMIVL